VIDKFFVEGFEEIALVWATQKPLCWFQYMVDTFAIWLHGPKKLKGFLDHLNNIHQSIQFTMETEWDFTFLGIDIYRRLDGSLGHNVYCKHTQTNLYITQATTITTNPTSLTHFLPWCIRLELCANRTAGTVIRNFLKVTSTKTAIVPTKFVRLSALLCGFLCPMMILTW
jgi:hypothetical protein